MKNVLSVKKLLCSVFVVVLFVGNAFAYDATVNFKQQFPELVAGWLVKAGPAKGGPYTITNDCGKPVLKTDSTYDCKVAGVTANPLYAIVVPYDSAKKELAKSEEATVSVTVPAPTDLKIVVTVTTVATISRRGGIVAKTSIKKESIPVDQVVKEGTKVTTKGNTTTTTTTIIFG